MPLIDEDYTFETTEETTPITYYSDVLEALTVQNEMLSEQNDNLKIYLEKFEDTIKCQADIYTLLEKDYKLLEKSYKELETVTEQLTAQNEKLVEINQYTAYAFAIILVFVLYRILGGALNAIFGG